MKKKGTITSRPTRLGDPGSSETQSQSLKKKGVNTITVNIYLNDTSVITMVGPYNVNNLNAATEMITLFNQYLTENKPPFITGDFGVPGGTVVGTFYHYMVAMKNISAIVYTTT